MGFRRPQFLLPEFIDDRLDQILQLTREEGNNVSRSEIMATLIFHSTLDGDAMGYLVRQYRRSSKTTSTSTKESRRPGPRPLLRDQS